MRHKKLHVQNASRAPCRPDSERFALRQIALTAATVKSNDLPTISLEQERKVMPYTYSKVDDLQKTDMVGSHQCVALVQVYAGAPSTLAWRKGDDVVGNAAIKKGTAIATFIDAKYPNRSTGNHAAFYLKDGVGGIYIMDQWKTKPGGKVSSRFIPRLGKDKKGRFIRPSNNADAYSIIE
ncbi:BPSL0067 family protein [Pseudoduganella aquatica]|uniref:BPSL0067 family protein n=1 Tax=Pseudoduganella aquatica TaxID=2660641 RepID=UPI001E447244|nr:BPSL0067 family protein [Pseudoduganella aquatica]